MCVFGGCKYIKREVERKNGKWRKGRKIIMLIGKNQVMN